ITAALATLSFVLIQFNGSKDYWKHIFWFPGVNLPLKLLMMVVELVGLLTKPVALAIRLFANISAGHFMILALISLIFIMGKAGQNPGGAFGIMPLSLAFSLFILTLEVLVAIVQAYIFTLLTTVFIGQAMESHDEHHAHDAHH
ncbi:MAG: F0F1 ATP synthase subunit A, partial [Bacteroidia bacterium]|nr:F0F1 ATP synthase subunit A [Bacteroidia bacterium]